MVVYSWFICSPTVWFSFISVLFVVMNPLFIGSNSLISSACGTFLCLSVSSLCSISCHVSPLFSALFITCLAFSSSVRFCFSHSPWFLCVCVISWYCFIVCSCSCFMCSSFCISCFLCCSVFSCFCFIVCSV